MTQETEKATETKPLRSYGRRKGKRLSPRKERLVADLLPQLRPDLDRPAPAGLAALFPAPVQEVWLEIGFGSGEHLIWQAGEHPDVGIIGCEPYINGVATLLGTIEDRGLQSVLVHDGDAREVLAWLPEGSIRRAFVLFPDPWPKKRQTKRRLIAPETVAALARALAPGGVLRFASDDLDYASQAEEVINQSGDFAQSSARQERPADWPETRYERKALSESRKPAYLEWQRL